MCPGQVLLDHEALSEHLDLRQGGEVEVVYRPGLRMATASGDDVRVWELPSGEPYGWLSHRGPVRRLDRCQGHRSHEDAHIDVLGSDRSTRKRALKRGCHERVLHGSPDFRYCFQGIGL